MYVPILTLSTDDNGKLLQQVKSGFERTIFWNKHQPKAATENAPNQYLDHFIDSLLRQ